MPTNFLSSVLFSYLRHALTFVAGWLVSIGWLKDTMQDQVVGVSLALVAVIWAVVNKVPKEQIASLLRGIADNLEKNAKVAVPALLLAVMVLAPGTADAQTRKQSPTPQRGIISTAVKLVKSDDFWTQLTQASLKDLEYAVALEQAANTTGSLMRAKCWTAWGDLIRQTSGANVTLEGAKLTGEAFVFTRAAQMAQVADALQPDSPFQIACAPVAARLKKDVRSLVGAVIGGSLSLAAFGL